MLDHELCGNVRLKIVHDLAVGHITVVELEKNFLLYSWVQRCCPERQPTHFKPSKIFKRSELTVKLSPIDHSNLYNLVVKLFS
jgi:hypothetical protein